MVDEPERLPRAPVTLELRAVAAGVVAGIPPRKIGHAIIALGGGRSRTDDVIDPAVGVVIPVKPGTAVRRGDVLAVVHARTGADAERCRRTLEEAIVVGESAPPPLPLVSHRVTAEGVEAVR